MLLLTDVKFPLKSWPVSGFISIRNISDSLISVYPCVSVLSLCILV